MKLKQIIGNIPWLDELRTETLASICAAGTKFFDDSFAITKIVSPSAREYMNSGKPVIVSMNNN